MGRLCVQYRQRTLCTATHVEGWQSLCMLTTNVLMSTRVTIFFNSLCFLRVIRTLLNENHRPSDWKWKPLPKKLQKFLFVATKYSPNGLWIEGGGGGAPPFFLLDEKSMKKLLNWKNLGDMWLNISSATYDTKIETRGRVERIKHCMSSGEIRPPPSIRSILCVFVRTKITTTTTPHISSTQRVYRHV